MKTLGRFSPQKRYLHTFARLAACALPAVTFADWDIAGGTTRLEFAAEQLARSGITFEPAAPSPLAVDPDGGLTIQAGSNGIVGWSGQGLRHQTGFIVRTPSEAFSCSRATLVPGDQPFTFDLRDDLQRTLFTIENLHPGIDREINRVYAMSGDLFIAEELASSAGHAALTRFFAGDVFIQLDVLDAPGPVSESGEFFCPTNFGPTVDLSLIAMDQIAQVSRDPGVQIAFAPSVRLQNVGLFDVYWYWAIVPLGWNGTNLGSHPFLIMNFYREYNGGLQQIGRSDLKHAWNSQNSACSCPGGQVMYVGCADTYGIGNNAEPFYMGPRDELTAHLGTWESMGSHFDALPIDNERDHGFLEDSHDTFDHILSVAESDLSTSGATYYIEAWYIAELDTNIHNNIGHRSVSQSLVADNWIFTFTDGGLNSGGALNAWVNPASPGPGNHHTMLDTREGHLQLAVRTWTNLDTTIHYEYALMNLDYDRQIESFSVPVAGGAALAGFGFTDVDDIASNDWPAVAEFGRVTWTAPLVAGSVNACDWGTLFSFRFDADVPPAENAALLTIHEPGDGSVLLVETLAPQTAPDLDVPLMQFEAGPSGSTSSWSSLSGAVYRLQTTEQVTPPAGWSNLGSAVTSDGSVITFDEPTTPATQQFFRVNVEELPFE
jgi:hypothetical protein